MNAKETKTIILHGFGSKSEYTGSFPYVWATGTGYAANSTDIAPIQPTLGTWPVFNGTSWELKEDHIGKKCFDVKTREGKQVDYYGPLEAGFTLLEPKTEFEVWDGKAWTDPRTEAELTEAQRRALPTLTSRQFFLTLVHYGLYTQVYSILEQIDDPEKKLRVKVELDRSPSFIRSNSSIAYMQSVLGISDSELDSMWEFGAAIPD